MVAALAAVLSLSGCRSSVLASATPSTPAPPVVTATPPASATPSATPSTAPGPSLVGLKLGNKGPAVLDLQQRLAGFGYWLGTPNGTFGDTTQQAVFALQKAARLSPSGTVTAATQAALYAGVRPAAKSTSGRLIEVDLTRDLLMFVTDGHVNFALNTSTGGGYVFYDQGVRAVAITPKGRFTTNRTIDGWHRSTLGLMFRPRYFHDGFAIHGDDSVPAHPVSHGCVRVSNAAISWIWATNLDPIGTTVWIY